MSSSPECKRCGNYIHYGKIICDECLPLVLQKERNRVFEEVKNILDECISTCDDPDKEDAFSYAIDVIDEVCSKNGDAK